MAAPVENTIRQDIVDTGAKTNTLGLNQGTSGNISARNDSGFLITPSGIAYETMNCDQIVPMDLDGRHRGDWLPSSEWRMHLDIYRARPEAEAIVHVHSPHATALSCLRLEIPAFHYMIAVAGGTTIRCADYATFGTQDLSDRMMIALQDRNGCLLANHGQICFGPSLKKALWLAGEIEALSRQYWIAKQMGEPVILGEEEMATVIARFRTYGKQTHETPETAQAG